MSEMINLKLGDIIQIYNPVNEILNNQFIIDYIDPNKIKLINIEDFTPYTLKINKDNTLGDQTTESIHLIYRNNKEGYARQNGLSTGKWINIYFGGDIPHIITAKITNLEEDMIEIKTFPDNDVLYINFEYKGIPENIPFQKFEIREKPEAMSISAELKKEKETEEAITEEAINEESETEEYEAKEAETEERNTNNLHELIIKADEIKFGNQLFNITQYVNVESYEERFNLETQCNDFLDDMLSNIPTSQRTPYVLNNIHLIIERFKQLRNTFSEFDEHKNVKSPLIKSSNWKPLLHNFLQFNKSLYWILPVAKNIKKLYINQDNTTQENISNTEFIYLNNDLTNLINIIRVAIPR
jgi:hypothetical protein